MIKLYGIPNCNKIRNTQKLLNDNKIAFEFINVRKTPVSAAQLKKMAVAIGLESLYNKKGTTYRRLKIDYDQLDETMRFDLLLKEQAMIKRPLLEKDGKYMTGFDENVIMGFIA
jgi:arsenate reductase